MPSNTISVARPARWGNPHIVTESRGLATCLALFGDSVCGIWDPCNVRYLDDDDADASYAAHHAWLKRLNGHPLELVRGELRGRNLACWCALERSCHADILLDLANR